MKENKHPIVTLHDLLDHDASKFSAAESALKVQVEEWIKSARSLKLKNVLRKYKDHISEHLQKMESFVKEEKLKALAVKNKVMLAMIDESHEKLEACADDEVKDACLISCIQTINHFKISTYGTAAAYAKELGMERHAEVFRNAEMNEKQIDERLTEIASHDLNLKAKSPVVLPFTK